MTFDAFMAQVRLLLEPTAQSKGYNQTGVDGPNDLYRFVQQTTGGDGHAIGEVIYKLRRYAAKGNPEDVLKAAAWCFLILKHRTEPASNRQQVGTSAGESPQYSRHLLAGVCRCSQQGDGCGQ